MGVTREQAAKNKEAILTTAERLFREKGVDAVGLAELMGEAGFTQGGFYNHFQSKDALVNEVVERALRHGGDEMDSAIAQSQSLGKDALERQIAWYLSPAQRDDIACGCPLAGFAGDVSRLRGKGVEAYSEILEHTFDTFSSLLQKRHPSLTSKAARQRAIALFSRMAGAVVLSRAVLASNHSLADEILAKARESALEEVRSAGQVSGKNSGRKKR